MIQFALEYFTWTFAYLTSVLSLWGLFLSHYTLRIVMTDVRLHKPVRLHDIALASWFLLTSLFFLSIIFIFPEFGSEKIHILFFIEIWYAFFMIYFSATFIRIP